MECIWLRYRVITDVAPSQLHLCGNDYPFPLKEGPLSDAQSSLIPGVWKPGSSNERTGVADITKRMNDG